jgi:5-methylcytosine-specific restriction endonuclease McrA
MAGNAGRKDRKDARVGGARLNFKFVEYLRTVRSEKPRIAFEAKELACEVMRCVSQAERDLVTNSARFLKLEVWNRLRYDVHEDNDGLCEVCGHDGRNRGGLNVDHKRNRRDYPQLALLWSNLQILCGDCNKGKGNRYNTDWRKRRPPREKAASQFTPSAATLAQVREIAPGWNETDLLKIHRVWCKGKKPADYPDAAFIGWVRWFTKGKPPPS